MNTAIMINWSITSSQNGFIAPELQRYILVGNIYEDSRRYFPDGSQVQTGSILEIKDCGTHKLVSTSRTEYKVFPDDIDLEYERAFPGAYERLNMLNSDDLVESGKEKPHQIPEPHNCTECRKDGMDRICKCGAGECEHYKEATT